MKGKHLDVKGVSKRKEEYDHNHSTDTTFEIHNSKITPRHIDLLLTTRHSPKATLDINFALP
jgi:hypothetical protein